MKTQRGTFVLYSSIWKSLSEYCLWLFISYGAGLGLPCSSFFFSGGAGKLLCTCEADLPPATPEPAPETLPTSVKFMGDPAHPVLAHVSSLGRDKAPEAHWFHPISTWSHYQTHFTLYQRKVCRRLGKKLERGGYKSIQYKILIPGNAKLKKMPF